MPILCGLAEQCLQIFMDDFSIYGDSVSDYLTIESSEECVGTHFWPLITKNDNSRLKRLLLSHIISSEEVKIDEAKVELIANLSLPTCGKDIYCIVAHVGFYYRFIEDISEISKPLSLLLTEDLSFRFSKEYSGIYEAYGVIDHRSYLALSYLGRIIWAYV